MKKYIIMLAFLLLTVFAVMKMVKGKDLTEYENAMTDAEKCMENGYYIDAVTFYDKALTEQKNDINALKGKLGAYEKACDDMNFCNTATQILKLTGGDIDTYEALVKHYYEMSQYSAAYDYLEKGMECFPDEKSLHDIKLTLDGSYMEYMISGSLKNDYCGKYAVVSVTEFSDIYNTRTDAVETDASETDAGEITDSSYLQIIDESGNPINNSRFSTVCEVAEPEADGETMVSGIKMVSDTKDENTVVKLSYYDSKGNLRMSPEYSYEYLGLLHNNLALVEKNGKWGYIDDSFNEKDQWYEDATSFRNGIAAVKKNGKWGIIDTEMNIITDFVFDEVLYDIYKNCSASGAIVFKKGTVYGLMDLKGNILTEGLETAYAFSSDNEVVLVKMDGEWRIMNAEGSIVSELMSNGFDEIGIPGHGFIPFRKGDKWGYLNYDGEIVVDAVFSKAGTVSEYGAAICEKNRSVLAVRFYKDYEENGFI